MWLGLGLAVLIGGAPLVISSLWALSLSAALIVSVFTVWLVREMRRGDVGISVTADSVGVPEHEPLLNQFVHEQVREADDELTRVQALIQEAIGTLISSFASLSSEAQKQLVLAERLTKGEAVDDARSFSFSQFVEQISEAMSGFVEKTVENSKVAMILVERMDQLVEQVNGVKHLVDSIHAITNQTNMLALNAAIEAARAGEVGRGFAIVAEEVTRLSARTEAFSTEISDMMSSMQSSVVEAGSLINQLASQDMMFALQAKQGLDATSEQITRMDGQMAESLDQLHQGVMVLAGHVGDAIRSMQFQDLTTQLMTHIGYRLQGVMEALARAEQSKDESGSVPAESADQLRDTLNDLFGQLREKLARNPVSQDSMSSGSVELF